MIGKVVVIVLLLGVLVNAFPMEQDIKKTAEMGHATPMILRGGPRLEKLKDIPAPALPIKNREEKVLGLGEKEVLEECTLMGGQCKKGLTCKSCDKVLCGVIMPGKEIHTCQMD